MTAPVTWADGIKAVHREAAGVLNMTVVRPREAVKMIGEAMAGDVEAAKLLVVMARASARITAAKDTRAPMLCGACPRPLRDNRYALVVALPSCDDPSNSLALAICHRCGTSSADIKLKATAALKKIWPEIRPVSVTHPSGGRA